LVSRILFNPQEKCLRVLNPEVDAMMAIVGQRLVGAEERGKNCWPVPMHAFWGLQDNVVQEASARGPFEAADPLPGDHFSVIQPEDRLDPRYTAISEALFQPIGHRAIYEIELWKSSVRVWPLPRAEYEVRYGVHKRKVLTDNGAYVERSITFDRKNRCTRPYLLRYLTCNTGFVKPTLSHPNEAPPQEKAIWEMTGMEVRFGFTPNAGETYTLRSDVLKGFEDGDRLVHSHLADDSYVKKLRQELDLSAFLHEGWTLKKEPTLYFIPHRAECSVQEALPSDIVLASVSDSGRWIWELENVQVGVVRLEWDVQAPAGASSLGAYTGR
jgi:hypothetical protein